MKRVVVLVLLCSLTSATLGTVSTRVCEADGNTPFDNQPIMVGTKLTIIVDSNVAEYWSGSLVILGSAIDNGVLSGRDFNDMTFDWEGSRTAAAGVEAQVWDWEEPGIDGFDLYTGSTGIEAGDWFIIDYTATAAGDCNVAFYDHSISWVYPIYYLPFSHVPSRDFNGDHLVGLGDFAVFSLYWQAPNCSDPNWCEGVDLDRDGDVDFHDLELFVDYWLETTE